jgi:hypothetical protein
MTSETRPFLPETSGELILAAAWKTDHLLAGSITNGNTGGRSFSVSDNLNGIDGFPGMVRRGYFQSTRSIQVGPNAVN